jgi:hypothetical protein
MHSNNQLMTLETELPMNLLLPLTTIQQQTQNILPTIIYCQLKYTANDNKLPTTVSMSEEKFSLAERIKNISKIKCIRTFYLRISVLQHSLSKGNSMLPTHKILP